MERNKLFLPYTIWSCSEQHFSPSVGRVNCHSALEKTLGLLFIAPFREERTRGGGQREKEKKTGTGGKVELEIPGENMIYCHLN